MSYTQYQSLPSFGVIQERRYATQDEGIECSGPFLLAGLLTVETGSMTVHVEGRAVRHLGPGGLWWFMPPWSIFHYQTNGCSIHSKVHIFRPESLDARNWTQGPAIQPARDPYPLPMDGPELERWIKHANLKPLYHLSQLSPISLKVKRTIEANSGSPILLGQMAQQLKLNATVMGRLFKRDFGITPKCYLNRLKIIDSIAHMLCGQSPTDACFKAGFGDLSRFYKQFKNIAGTTPGTYAKDAEVVGD